MGMHDSLGDDGRRDGMQGLRQAANGTPGELISWADQLFVDLEELAMKHHAERTRCLEGWLRRQDFLTSTWSSPRSLQFGRHGQTPGVVMSEQEVLKQPERTLSPASLSSGLVTSAEDRRRRMDRPETGFTHSELSKVSPARPMGKPGTAPPPCFPKKATDGEDVEAKVQRLKRASLLNSERDLKKKRKKKAAFQISSKSMGFQQTLLQRITQSRAYEILSGLLIGMNAACLGWQVQWTSEHARDASMNELADQTSNSVFFDVLGALFTVAFTIELSLRWVADGFFDFFRTEELGWCVLDIVVVGVGLLELASSVVFQGNMPLVNEITLLRILRIMRVVKVLRIIRVVRFFRELRMMIFSIMGSCKSLLWVILVLSLLFFCFGIVLTSGAVVFLTENSYWQDAAHADLVSSFGTLDNSILSLFMAMSGGNDWSLYYQALLPLQISYRVLFLLFITFSIFAVVNIVTGVFVQSALECNNHDREIVVHEELESKKEYCEAMRQFFEEIDEDGTGTIGYEEFEGKLDDERVVAYFNALKLDVSDAAMLFNLLDFDQSGEIHIDEFLVGCYKLQGESRNLDMKVMQLEVKWLREAFHHFCERLEEEKGVEGASTARLSLNRKPSMAELFSDLPSDELPADELPADKFPAG